MNWADKNFNGTDCKYINQTWVKFVGRYKGAISKT